jgi:hypothetical protein
MVPPIDSVWLFWVIQHRNKAFLPIAWTVAATGIAEGRRISRRNGFA